jgi:hypothetical protein
MNLTTYQKIKEKYTAYEEKRLTREDRKRAFGAGYPFKLSLTDRVLMLLIYYHVPIINTTRIPL